MNFLRAAMGPASLLGKPFGLSSASFVAARMPGAKLPWVIKSLQRQGTAVVQRPPGAHFVREHVAVSCEPVIAQPRTWGFSAASAMALGATIGGIGYLCGGDSPGGATFALAAAAFLNLSILAHEGGHLLAARALGVAVQEFSVGIGPRVAWWQGRTTTYSLRALPLLGYVRFMNAAQLHTAAAGAAGMHGTHAARAAAAAHELRLLENQSAGRRAVVLVAGVVANMALAAAFTAWQVFKYGSISQVVRPGVRIQQADGWFSGDGEEEEEGENSSRQQQQQLRRVDDARDPRRLQEGDVVLSVGQWRMPAGGSMENALVFALGAAAVEGPPPVAGCTAPDCDATGPECRHLALYGAVQTLDGVQMAVLRTQPGGSLVPERTVIHMAASDLLRYETLSLTPNLRLGYRPPADTWEAVRMIAEDLISSTRAVIKCWANILASATGTGAAGSSNTSQQTQPSTAADPSGSSSRSSSSAGGNQVVGPLGMVASAAEYMVEIDRVRVARGNGSGRSDMSNKSGSRSHSEGSRPVMEQAMAELEAEQGPSGRDATSGAASSSYTQFIDESLLQQPPPLISLGILLNVQLALMNLLPLPVLDGGKLAMVAMEAVRGGRRLSVPLERTALLGSALLMGCWGAALLVRDVVDLADKAAVRLAANLETQHDMYGSWWSPRSLPQPSRHDESLTAASRDGESATTSVTAATAAAAVAAPSDLRMRVQVTAVGGGGAGGGDNHADAGLDAAAASAVATESLAL